MELTENQREEVLSPSHYAIFPDGTEAIDIIRKLLTREEFLGYCKGNVLKYRLRAGDKGHAGTDLAKANIYRGWMEEKE